MASSVWKGYISFGLISVPIRMYVAAREQHIGFNQIHASCGSRIKQQLFCPTDERVVERDEIVKGYPTGDGGYVTVTSDELKQLEAESSQTMSIVQFVHLDEVDPLYYESSYYTVAEEPGRRAYALMMQGMQHLKLGAVANITLHQREQVVLIRPYAHGLVLHTLYYPEEVRELDEYGTQQELQLQPQEVQLAEQFMQQLASPFHPEAFKNTYQERVEQLIESKGAGKPQPEVEAPKKPAAPAVNLMEALRQSIQAREAAAGVKPIRTPAPPEPAAAPPEHEAAKEAEKAAPAPRTRRKKAS
ncbi:MAG TPA: Ku protein [Acidobacteriaceae bacterium]